MYKKKTSHIPQAELEQGLIPDTVFEVGGGLFGTPSMLTVTGNNLSNNAFGSMNNPVTDFEDFGAFELNTPSVFGNTNLNFQTGLIGNEINQINQSNGEINPFAQTASQNPAQQSHAFGQLSPLVPSSLNAQT